MRRHLAFFIGALSAALTSAPAVASDACTTREIHTQADIDASDGTQFTMKSFFHTRHSAALKQIRKKKATTIAVEGPFVWSDKHGKQALGDDELKSFALGHQFHALMLHFDKIVDNVQRINKIAYDDGKRSGLVGDWPFGGKVQLILDKPGGSPEALKLSLTGSPEILVTFHDWRALGSQRLPYEIRVHDGDRTFIYSYKNIIIVNRSPLWFAEQIAAPNLDEVQIYRLHRRVLAAHCLGDADMIAASAAPDQININKGEVSHASPSDLKNMFEGIFGSLSYTEYHDLRPPLVEVSKSGDLGWLAATVRPIGNVTTSGNAFNDRWSWLMAVEKINGRWKIAAISASRTP